MLHAHNTEITQKESERFSVLNGEDERLGKSVYTRTSYPWILNLRTTGWGI